MNSRSVQEFVGHCSCRRTYQLKIQCSEILNIYTVVFIAGQIPSCSGAVLFFGLNIYIHNTDATEPSSHYGIWLCTFHRGVSLKTTRGNYMHYLLFCIHIFLIRVYTTQNKVFIMITWMCVSWETVTGSTWETDWCASLLFACRSIPQLDN